MNTKKRVTITISKILLEKINNDMGDVPRSRFIERILKSYYKLDKLNEGLKK